MTPNYWERIRDTLNEDAVILAPEHFTIATDPGTAADTTVTWTDAAGDVRLQPDEEFETEWAIHEDGVNPTPPLRKSARFTARIAIEITIELWTWLADTGADEDDWPGWDKYMDYRFGGNTNPLCAYAFRYLKRNLSGSRATCDYCPYRKFFGRHCNDKGTPYDLWCVVRSHPARKNHAQAFLDELLQLQKAIILNPKSVLPGSQQ